MPGRKVYSFIVRCATVIITIVAMLIPITNHGGIFNAVRSSASKYRINPAEE